MLGSPHPSAAACWSALPSHSAAAGASPRPERDEPEDRQVLRRVEPELLLGELERSLRVLARELELAAMDGDERDRQVVLRHLEPVLDRDVARAGGVLGRERPAPGPELDPREAPERVGAPRLVALAPLPMLALEQGARLVPPRGRREGVHDGERRLLHQLARRRRRSRARRARAAAPARPRRRRTSRGSPARRAARARSASSSSSSASSSAARACSSARTYPFRKRVAHARRQWITDCSAGREAASPQRFLEQRDGTVDALELGEEDERLGAQRPVLRLVQQSVAIVRARVHSPAARCARAAASARRWRSSVLVRRRQPERLLGELGRDGRRTTIGRQCRGAVEHAGDVGVRRVAATSAR